MNRRGSSSRPFRQCRLRNNLTLMEIEQLNANHASSADESFSASDDQDTDSDDDDDSSLYSTTEEESIEDEEEQEQNTMEEEVDSVVEGTFSSDSESEEI
jgi:hypothetical protein